MLCFIHRIGLHCFIRKHGALLKEMYLTRLHIWCLAGTLFTGLLLVCRSGLKQKANKQHEKEKDYMATLQCVGIDASFYASQTAVQ